MIALSLAVVLLFMNIFLSPYLVPSVSSLIWLSVGVLLMMPLILFTWWKLEQVIVLERKGIYCQGCGCDLNGSEHAQCPECGKTLSCAKEVQG